MPLNEHQKTEIKKLLRDTLKEKIKKYARESPSLPFLETIIRDPSQIAAYSFTHSIATTLGQSIFEKVAKIVAEPHFEIVKTQYTIKGKISSKVGSLISNILLEYKNETRKPDKEREIAEILEIKSTTGTSTDSRVDLYLKRGDNEFYLEIKTAKPNIDVFKESKAKLLKWVALSKKPVITIIAIPYNPYPHKYDRFTIQGILDIKRELLVAEDFWKFLNNGDPGTYKDVLNLFDEVGREYHADIQSKIKSIAESKIDGFKIGEKSAKYAVKISRQTNIEKE
jgi:hypothetical protein